MLKRMSIKKILISSLTLFALFLLYIMPNEKVLDAKQELEYVNLNVLTHSIYLLDSNNMVARTNVIVKSIKIEELAREIIEILICEGTGESSVPSGFKSIIPSNTKINKLELTDDLITIDFSKDFLDINSSLEEKMIEAIVFSLTDIENIKHVKITVEDNELKSLPNSKKNIPLILDRSFGINKDYDISSSKEIASLTLYYVSKYNDEFYYVPVTKYLNTNNEKIEVIIEQLKNPSNNNLMSFIDDKAKLTNYEINDKTINLEFNQDILTDFEEKEILEEVIYTISMSVSESYDVDDVVFKVEGEEIQKSILKGIDCN